MNRNHVTRWSMVCGTLLGVLAITCGDNPEKPKDTTPPALQSVSPVDGATDVAITASIHATFTEAIDPGSVTDATFSISPTMTCAHGVDQAIATMIPSGDLDYGTTYTVTLTTGVKDLAGNSLVSPHSWSFTTVARTQLVAVAGTDQDVARATAVSLDGSGSSGPPGTMTYNWTQLDGPDVTNGAGSLHGVHPTFTAPGSVSTVVFGLTVQVGGSGGTSPVDTVCVYALVDPQNAFWVSTRGHDSNPGTRAQPLRKIQKGIDKAKLTGADVYVAQGTYQEAVVLATQVELYGGFSPTWVRDPSALVASQISPSASKAIEGTMIEHAVVDGFTIRSADAAVPGGSSYGVYLDRANDIVLRNNDIAAGRGRNGVPGAAPPSDGTRGANGTRGGGGTCDGTTPGTGGDGGAGGDPGGGAGGAGGQGGPEGANAGHNGVAGIGPDSGSAGTGGAGGTTGQDGTSGTNAVADGTAGDHGGAGAAFGAVNTTSGYVVSSGENGQDGEPGSGGGGGGGGGGQGGFWVVDGTGNGGSGGGGGGGYGAGGFAGGGGGGSFAVFLIQPIGVQLENNVITTGVGGVGGVGTRGGNGGQGGTGGITQDYCTDEIGAGGAGGNGGKGGNGGAGGGGGGGPSIGLLVYQGTNIVVTPNNVITPGTPGVGGTSPGSSGATGEQAARKDIP